MNQGEALGVYRRTYAAYMEALRESLVKHECVYDDWRAELATEQPRQAFLAAERHYYAALSSEGIEFGEYPGNHNMISNVTSLTRLCPHCAAGYAKEVYYGSVRRRTVDCPLCGHSSESRDGNPPVVKGGHGVWFREDRDCRPEHGAFSENVTLGEKRDLEQTLAQDPFWVRERTVITHCEGIGIIVVCGDVRTLYPD